MAQISIFGPQKYAVRVQVDPDMLAARGIGLDEVQTALAAASSTTPVGALSGAQKAATLQADTQLTQASGYVPLIIAYRNGAPVRLGDVARVIDSVQTDKAGNWYNGQRAITVAVFRQADANTVDVVNQVKALLPVFRAELPGAIEFNILADRAAPIQAAVTDMQHTLLLTVVLVVLVIFLFVRRLSATIIPALALPVSIVGTFAAMYLGGYSLNNVSLMALTLAVGFVVDDAIVMLENIVRHTEAGMAPMEAALKGSREITFTIMSMTISLVAVFIPVFFMGGVVGRVFHEFAIVIGIAILVSGFVSLTLTPMLCSRFLRPPAAHTEMGMISRVLERAFAALLRGYERSLGAGSAPSALHHPGDIVDHRAHRLSDSTSFPKASSRSRTTDTSSEVPRPRRTSPSAAWWKSSSRSMPSFGRTPMWTPTISRSVRAAAGWA